MKKVISLSIICFLIIGALFAYLKWNTIFQRGNPIPYLKAIIQISDDNTYVKVEGKDNIFISRNGECPELFRYYEETYDLEFVEQAGSGYLFTNGTANFVISSEVYWGKYKVWVLDEGKQRFK